MKVYFLGRVTMKIHPFRRVGIALTFGLFNLFLILPGAASGLQRDQVCVYEDVGYRGRSLCLPVGQSIRDLKSIDGGWNDKISSIRINGQARVLIYRDSRFRGESADVRYDIPDLKREGNWNDQISSIQVISADGDGRYSGPGYGDRVRLSDDAICVYEDDHFRGRSRCWNVGDRVPSLPSFEGGFWNDRISSIRLIGQARAVLYEDSNYRGDDMVIRSDIPDLKKVRTDRGDGNWNDRISSLKIFRDRLDWNEGRPIRGSFGDREGGVCFYEDTNYRGDSICFRIDDGSRDLSKVQGGWGDRISSIRVFGGARASIFRDDDYGGDRVEVVSDVPDLKQWRVRHGGGSWNDQISSVRVH